MHRVIGLAALTLLWTSAAPAAAQLIAAKDGPIVYGHHHLNATSVDEHKRFWIDTLGGVLARVGANNLEIIKFPNALIFMRAQAPTGPTKGTTFNHVGFSVPDLRRVVDRLRAGGYRMVTAEEAPANVKVQDDIGIVAGGGEVSGIAYVLGPDGVKVELVEMKAQAAPIAHHHLHFFTQAQAEMHAWYTRVFGAAPAPSANPAFLSARLPGLGMNFTSSSEPVVGTQGRALDHIGFEVRNLEEFCRRLEAQGITLAVSYRKVPALDIAIAFIRDPWGTYIELTEGLAAIP
jgi:catechol 2,3-dioxygenase-like lactoylglutathione lyase family enzyme